MQNKEKKSGFVAILGRSNVGKSTLLNALIGTKVAIVTSKPQTTRNAIQGILHGKNGQIVFVDTPGIFQKSKDVLTSKLTKRAKEALVGIDAVIYLVDPTRDIGNEESIVFNMVKVLKIPKFLVINKMDLEDRPYFEKYKEMAKIFDNVFEISALKQKNLKNLVSKLFEVLPYGPEYYPEHQFTNVENAFWFSEFIREKVFDLTSDEIPYSINVEIEEMAERPNNLTYIKALIITSNERYKKMLIGSEGRKIKQIGSFVRKELELITNKKIYLDLNVKVDEHWIEKF